MPASDMQLGLDALHQQAVQLESLAEKEVNRKAEWAAKLQVQSLMANAQFCCSILSLLEKAI